MGSAVMGKDLPWRGNQRRLREAVASEPRPEGEAASQAKSRGGPVGGGDSNPVQSPAGAGEREGVGSASLGWVSQSREAQRKHLGLVLSVLGSPWQVLSKNKCKSLTEDSQGTEARGPGGRRELPSSPGGTGRGLRDGSPVSWIAPVI